VGNALYFTGIVRDLTETNVLREQIKRSERLAAMGQLVAEITHEIKNPLMLIGGFIGQLIRRTDDKKSIAKLNIVVDEVRRLENLLSELRELYRPQGSDSKEIDLSPLLKDVFALVKGECDAVGIGTALDIEGGVIPIQGDERRLKQVFLNLMKNGVEALDKGGQLSVRVSVDKDLVDIVIEDDGCGISSENLERVFDPFFTTKSSGSGLGLSVTKRIIEDHQGSRMSLESQVGKGTTFKVTMPIER
jgi:signal transduction histidine kinase